jgi:SAM-dependent methyltransferase
MTNTVKSFKDKWNNNPTILFKETLDENSEIFKWLNYRNGFKDGEEFRRYLSNKKRILDAGCGNGRVTALLEQYSNKDSEIIGIDIASADVAKDNLSSFTNVKIFQKDLMGDLKDLGKFDFIYCQEVLHHTKSPEKSFGNLCKILLPGGEIAIYVYKKKAPVREYVDDFIREKISEMSYEDAIKICDQITELGKKLSEMNVKIQVPNVDILEIKEGEYDLQRFVYYFFMKCFWNKDYSFQENSVINYEWYHPQLC